MDGTGRRDRRAIARTRPPTLPSGLPQIAASMGTTTPSSSAGTILSAWSKSSFTSGVREAARRDGEARLDRSFERSDRDAEGEGAREIDQHHGGENRRRLAGMRHHRIAEEGELRGRERRQQRG